MVAQCCRIYPECLIRKTFVTMRSLLSTTIVERLNMIFTRELASAFMLVNPATTDNDKNIIFDDPMSDPYNNTDDIPQLDTVITPISI